jgi:hypothetical protein
MNKILFNKMSNIFDLKRETSEISSMKAFSNSINIDKY